MKTEILNSLFAIYRNGVHKGNVRSNSISKAIDLYILDSGIPESFINNSEFVRQYKAELAIKGLHFN